jgi:hypothetical protein
MVDISKYSRDLSNTEIIYIKNFLSKDDSVALINVVTTILNSPSSESNQYLGYSNDGQINSTDKPYVFLGNYYDPEIKKIVDNASLNAKTIYEELYKKSDTRYFLDFGTINVMKPGGSMSPHADSGPGLTTGVDTPHGLVLYLNDDYEGGELYYPNLEITIKPEAGSLVIHPGNEDYLHGVSPVTSGLRYVTTAFSKDPLIVL